MRETVTKLSHIDHILKRPDSYVGPTNSVVETLWLLGNGSFYQHLASYSPALLKIFDEILVNAIDRNSLYPDKVKFIHVDINQEKGIISIENNGPLGGISVEKHETENIWNPELTFGHLLTSTNYNDNDERVVGGRNGYGSKLANIYSQVFQVDIWDEKNNKKYSQKWGGNMKTVFPPKVSDIKVKESKVKITFIPDWKLFGMHEMTTDVFKVFEKRVYDAAACTNTKCKVSFQKKTIKIKNFEEYSKMYLDEDAKVYSCETDRWSVCVTPSTDGTGLKQVSFVNGISTTKGGTHVDYIANMIATGVIDELAKKIKLKPQQVKNTFFVFVKATLVNPTFSSQIKSECTSKAQMFGSRFNPPKTFIKNVLKTGIQDEVMSLSKFREQKELKKSDGARKSKITGIPKLDDANFAGTTKSGKCTLIVTEGDSAKTLAVAGLAVVGRDMFGVFPLRGKCKNVRDVSVKQLMANQEFNDLKKILGLKQDTVYKSLSELRYGRLMIMTDADHDGSHIKGLILNMIHYFWPSLIDLGFVVSMITPIIKAIKGKESKSFFTNSSFRSWYGDGRGKTSWKIKYYKGLGTSTSAEAREYFKNISQLTVGFKPDNKATKSIVLAFDKTKADDRKTWLLENSEKNSTDLELDYGNISTLGVSDFIHKDLVNFSLANLKRSIACVADGLKPSQRKVMHACFTRNLKDEMKVAQLAAYVSEKTSYHHGEVSLADTIVKLAHTYTGSNNVNLLEPCGQFGTRLMGGKDASQTRYIFTKLTGDARRMFNPLDDPVLDYLDDDGKLIEPKHFVPVIPMVLVNGTEGIGTGFSCYVPPYNPDDIVQNIRNVLDKKPIKPMKPWFRGFKNNSKIYATDEEGTSWMTEGTMKNNVITELPPGRWTQDYKEHLDDLVEKKVISGYKNNSTTEDVYFEVYDYIGDNTTKDFKLQKTIRTSNMHLFHPEKGIIKYNKPENILIDFIEIRLQFYKKRHKYMVSALKKEMVYLENKAKFIKLVINEKIVIFRKSRQNLVDQIEKYKLAKIDGYDYLLNIKTYQYTNESVDELNKNLAKKSNDLKQLEQMTILDMWRGDL